MWLSTYPPFKDGREKLRLCSPPMATKSSKNLRNLSICSKCALLISGASMLCAMGWAPLYGWTRITSRLLVYFSFFSGRVRFLPLPLVTLCPLNSQLFDHAVCLLRPARSLRDMNCLMPQCQPVLTCLIPRCSAVHRTTKYRAQKRQDPHSACWSTGDPTSCVARIWCAASTMPDLLVDEGCRPLALQLV